MKNLPRPLKVLILFLLIAAGAFAILYLTDAPFIDAVDHFETELLEQDEQGNIGLKTWLSDDLPEHHTLELTVKGILVLISALLVMPLLLAWRFTLPGRFGSRK